MKFANIIMKRKGRCTIGDDIQILAIENLYRYMGIDYKEVVRIPFSELATYNGEYVILPISFPLHGYSHDDIITQYSDRIIPVFLGMAILCDTLPEKEVEYLRKFEPIGCRDQYTMEILRRYNIVAYLNGCITATLPRRNMENSKLNRKVFCIDIPSGFEEVIPEEIKKDCIYSTHLYMSDACPEGTEEMAKKVYNSYKDEARLIITTRLHAALPCAAMGIPVILVKDKISYRFTILNHLFPVYSHEEYGSIDWNPKVVEFEELKSKMLSVDSKRIMEAYNKYSDILELSEFYEDNTKQHWRKNIYFEAINDAIEYLKQNYSFQDSFEYCLWGITQCATMINRYVKENYKNAKLVGVIDYSKRIKFCGVDSTDKYWLDKEKDNVLCMVCAPAAMSEAKEYFKEINHSNYFLCWHDGLQG